MGSEQPIRRLPKNAIEVRERIGGALSAFARGEVGHWAVPIGGTLADAARSLGMLWSSGDPVPPDLRATIAPHLGCAPDDVATYSRLVRRLMRALPRAYGAGPGASTSGADPLLDDLLGNPRVVLTRAVTHDGRGKRHHAPIGGPKRT